MRQPQRPSGRRIGRCPPLYYGAVLDNYDFESVVPDLNVFVSTARACPPNRPLLRSGGDGLSLRLALFSVNPQPYSAVQPCVAGATTLSPNPEPPSRTPSPEPRTPSSPSPGPHAPSPEPRASMHPLPTHVQALTLSPTWASPAGEIGHEMPESSRSSLPRLAVCTLAASHPTPLLAAAGRRLDQVGQHRRDQPVAASIAYTGACYQTHLHSSHLPTTYYGTGTGGAPPCLLRYGLPYLLLWYRWCLLTMVQVAHLLYLLCYRWCLLTMLQAVPTYLLWYRWRTSLLTMLQVKHLLYLLCYRWRTSYTYRATGGAYLLCYR